MKSAETPVSSKALDRIKSVVGAKGWIQDPVDVAPHLEEPRGLYHGRTPLVVKPASTGEVAEVVRICRESRTPIVPQGGNTGLVGASVPHETGGEIVVSLSRMNRVRDIDPANDTITVEAGCVLADVQAAAAKADRLFPLSLGAEGSCQIGGNLSTNAGGTAVLRYGNMRELVLGLEVVLPDGEIWDGLRGLRKDNTGYDLKQLFIGAEGTLGIVTAAVLRLFPRPREVATALAAIRDPAAAIEILSRARAAAGEAVTALEYMPRNGIDMALKHAEGTVDPLADRHDHYLLVELSSARADAGLGDDLEAILAAALEDGLVRDAVLAASETQARGLWRLREAIPETQKLEGGSIKHDVSVPISRVADFIAEASDKVSAALPGVRPVPFGHIGDGNIHFNLTQPEGADTDAFLAEWPRMNRIVHDVVMEMGGSFSAEHGVGRLKRDDLARYKSPVELDLMRRLKSALDPDGIMNPGKVL
ncbi:MAG: FAD-binding oxidoreductase [Alphaproteobacteria bacterium]|nr:FAD-binding oxidoreductase [Alphaproteobacteria bacterium]